MVGPIIEPAARIIGVQLRREAQLLIVMELQTRHAYRRI